MISYSYVGDVNTNLICCICHSPFLNPVVTTICSHTFCRTCIERSLEQQPYCPVDRSPLSLDELKPENLLLRNMVDELIVECPSKASGCKTTCQRQLLNAHLKETCQYVQVPCSEDDCEQMVLRRDLGKHTHDCVHRLVKCAACGTSVTLSELEEHKHECLEQETQCVACFATYKRSELSGHIATCSEMEIACAQSENGCSWRDKRKYLEDHLSKCSYEVIKGFFTLNDARMSSLRDENTVLKQKLSKAEASVQSFARELAIARRALGPWWRSANGSPCQVFSELTDPTTSAYAESSHSNPEQHRWRGHNPLSPLLTFSPESSPILPSNEVDSFGTSASPAPSLTDPAFLASYFPSSGTQPGEVPNANSPPVIPQTVQVDPLTRHLFPFSNRIQSIYPPPPIRFPDLPPPPSQTPPGQQPSSASLHARVAPIDRNSTLEGALHGLRNSVASVSAALDALARRTDVALTTENLRMNEEVGALRAIVHGLRMQVHALITERNGSAWGPTTTTTTTYYNQPPPAPHPPLVINSTTQTQTTKL